MTDGSTRPADVSASDLRVPVSAQDHLQGPDDAAVTLVEYADYQCPYSRRAHYVTKGLRRELGDRLRLVYRNFPLRDIHPYAQQAAEAAEAAATQGKFWEMHDVLFEHQRALEEADLRQYAAALGLDVERFAQDLAAHRYAGRIEDDRRGGRESGVRGTPTFFINGVRYRGRDDKDSLLAALGKAIAP